MATSAMKGVWTRMSKKYYEFYEGTTPLNTRNHMSCSSRWNKHLHPSLNKWHQALLTASRHESRANYYDEHHGCWEICKGWVLFEDPPQHRVGPTPMFGTASSVVDGDEDESLTIQETRVENMSQSEGSIPRAMGRNKARKLKENGKAKDDYTFQQEMVEERNHRHEERAKQIQEEMNNRNMQRNTLDYTPMSKAYFDRKKKKIMAQRQLFTFDYTPTMADDKDDIF
ncbi:hypothetical protein D8674_011794 [Pyrus ussuriensis x Pyrus communis]|uniref:No apical meristem-associated C-terminal domain-containing protein n=1 Tax=Pyrus ussuriensis x Pyrus communis TaxID=2448454 RepID=A0A5N5FZU3_9ROSA|nr:hypothetical protein D8674_011794 [Pyrus ussuriensis x Pyrus communis]